MFSSGLERLPLELQREESLAELEALFHRLANLERAFRPLLRSRASRSRASVQFRSSVCRALDRYLLGLSQEEQQLFRLVGR